MDIEKIIEQIVEKLTGDDQLMEKFKKDPVKMVTDVLGIKLDDDIIDAVVTAVKGKLDLDELKDKAEDLLGGLKGLFGK
ncbi:MAG: hypothetical protein E7329_02015 [Clostridiales bacterium]|nr:hypothetical protein [Clostridiales bacterium]